jgi:hypothetical protein
LNVRAYYGKLSDNIFHDSIRRLDFTLTGVSLTNSRFLNLPERSVPNLASKGDSFPTLAGVPLSIKYGKLKWLQGRMNPLLVRGRRNAFVCQGYRTIGLNFR